MPAGYAEGMSLISRTPTRLVGRKLVPWLVLYEVLRQTYAHWQEQLSPKERRRLTELLKNSRGRPGNLSRRERQEVRDLAAKLDLVALGKRASFSAVGLGGGASRK